MEYIPLQYFVIDLFNITRKSFIRYRLKSISQIQFTFHSFKLKIFTSNYNFKIQLVIYLKDYNKV